MCLDKFDDFCELNIGSKTKVIRLRLNSVEVSYHIPCFKNDEAKKLINLLESAKYYTNGSGKPCRVFSKRILKIILQMCKILQKWQ